MEASHASENPIARPMVNSRRHYAVRSGTSGVCHRKPQHEGFTDVRQSQKRCRCAKTPILDMVIESCPPRPRLSTPSASAQRTFEVRLRSICDRKPFHVTVNTKTTSTRLDGPQDKAWSVLSWLIILRYSKMDDSQSTSRGCTTTTIWSSRPLNVGSKPNAPNSPSGRIRRNATDFSPSRAYRA